MEGFSTRFHPPRAGYASVAYTYDPVGRVVTVTDPDGAASTTAYEGWRLTTTDAKGQQTRRTADAFGRLIQVDELNGAQTYTTTYVYGRRSFPDSLIYQLTEVHDAAG